MSADNRQGNWRSEQLMEVKQLSWSRSEQLMEVKLLIPAKCEV
jgi:hypothetical protein